MVPDLAIGKDDTPHHFRQHHSLTQIEAVADYPRELEVIDGLAPFNLRQDEQLVYRCGLEVEMTAQCRFDVAPLFGRKLAVGLGKFDQERARGELGISVPRRGCRFGRRGSATLPNELA